MTAAKSKSVSPVTRRLTVLPDFFLEAQALIHMRNVGCPKHGGDGVPCDAIVDGHDTKCDRVHHASELHAAEDRRPKAMPQPFNGFLRCASFQGTLRQVEACCESRVEHCLIAAKLEGDGTTTAQLAGCGCGIESPPDRIAHGRMGGSIRTKACRSSPVVLQLVLCTLRALSLVVLDQAVTNHANGPSGTHLRKGTLRHLRGRDLGRALRRERAWHA